jgi:AMP-binding enzyme C-terminal domain
VTIPNMRTRLRYQSPDLETQSLRVAIGMQRAERDDQALNRQGTDDGLVPFTHLTDTPVGCQQPQDSAPVTAARKAIPGWVPQCTSAAGFTRHEDVEAAFKAHSAIDDAVVLDAHIGTRGQNVVAVCSWAVGHTDTVDDVLASVRSRTSVDKMPGSIIVVDAIPHSGVDTVDQIAIGQIVSVSRLLHTFTR